MTLLATLNEDIDVQNGAKKLKENLKIDYNF